MKKVKITESQYNKLFTSNLDKPTEVKGGIKKTTSSLDESILNPEVQQAVSHLIHNIWLNPSQHGLSPFFKQNGITWGDIMDYLTAVGVVSGVAGGGIKLRNYFNTKFNKKLKKMNLI